MKLDFRASGNLLNTGKLVSKLTARRLRATDCVEQYEKELHLIVPKHPVASFQLVKSTAKDL